MPILIVEDAEDVVHLVREAGRDKKGRRAYTTKCGAEIERDETSNVTIWDGDVTCPGCAVPWV